MTLGFLPHKAQMRASLVVTLMLIPSTLARYHKLAHSTQRQRLFVKVSVYILSLLATVSLIQKSQTVGYNSTDTGVCS